MGEKISHIKVKFSNDFAENYQFKNPYFLIPTVCFPYIALSAFSIPLTVFMKTAGLWDKTDIFWSS